VTLAGVGLSFIALSGPGAEAEAANSAVVAMPAVLQVGVGADAATASGGTGTYTWDAARPDDAALPAGAVGAALGKGAITHDGPRLAAVQLRLAWAGRPGIRITGQRDRATTSGLRAVQAKAGLPVTGAADAATVAALRRMTRRGPQPDRRCLVDGPVICVDKTQKVLRYLVSGRVIKTLDANFGPEKGEPGHGEYSRTREGSFKVYRRSADHVSSGYGTQMKWSLFFDGAEAMHYSRFFRDGGYSTRSFGCVDIGDFAGARWVYNHSPLGTRFIVYH
jgi:hypothetical protein